MFYCINFKRTMRYLFLIILLIFFHTFRLSAQDTTSPEYQMPPKAIADLIDAPPTPMVSIDPTRQWMLIIDYPNLISIEEMAQPELRLAGIRINPKTHGPSRERYMTGLKLKNIKDGKEYNIKGLPARRKIRDVNWSPDGSSIAFVNTKENGQNLWVINVASKTAQKIVSDRISSVYGAPYEWLPDNNTIICKLFVCEKEESPVELSVPTGPVIQETSGKKAPARTYQDLLKDEHDKELFAYHFNVQLHKINIDGNETDIGSPGIIRRMETSPDGKFLLVETVHRPFSYLVPAYRFPYSVEVWDLDGNVVKQIADLPLAEEVPIGFGAVPTGPRDFNWRSDTPATLYWAEAQDRGDPKVEADIRDCIYTLEAPFIGKSELLFTTQLRYSGIRWGHKNLALLDEWWWKDRRVRTWRINPAVDTADTSLLFDYSWQDRYNDPGYPLMKSLPNGHWVLLTDTEGNTIYMAGDGASTEGDRPFVDAINVTSKEKKRLFRSNAPFYERPIVLIDIDKLSMITRRESITEPPNYFLRNIPEGTLSQITSFPHPTPQLKGVQKELIRYKRKDGVDMTATLYLPPAYKKEDGPLPMLMWAYPQEYKSADAAGQVTDSPYRFVRIGWWTPLLWLVHGYAVLDDPTMPIIGEGDEEPNDRYVEQLVSSAEAAIDEVVRRGVTTRDQIAIGGHSYGAFMTANLLAHSGLFVAGIARSGAYNRSLTPFGFQAEERTFWQAPEVYFAMSPFMHADSVNEPILLIHGQADNNSGTFPMQSERFYNAIKGHGGTARLVMLPLESHGYRSRESIMHMLWEMTNWLDRYVKNK
jgi:dipeptidyl aminopeptidase/acylaminoacyl peptidase